ncbi:ABC transporter permease [Clostridium cochlearium]|uniref:ABC transporter permease n=1 Tax=Clostridium cochlearium TaxID=1494 RepID=UPI001A9A582F|nr:iron ABC transporter permease [Clostridium cochlearium]
MHIALTTLICQERIVALLPTMAPSVVTGLAFIMLFGRRGIITYKLFNLSVDLYGWVGLWIVQSIAFFPLAYITISGVLKSISPNLELAAQNLGARGFTLFRTVTLKLATPGIASAYLLVAINSFADFGNPMLIGGNYTVLATEAYTQVTGNWDLEVAAALSLLLVISTMLVFFIQKYYLDKKSYVTVTGKPVSGLNRDIVSKKVEKILFAICLIMSIIILMIIGVVVCFAFTKAFGANNQFTLDNFKEGVLRSKPMRNSWIFSMIAAFITTIIGIVLGFLVVRKKFPGKNILDFLAMLPVSLPGTFIGLSLILAFNNKTLALTGTAAIVIIGMTIRQIPVGYRNSIAGFKQIDKSIEEASTNLGGNSFFTFIKVVLPMMKNALSVSILSLADHAFYGVASATAIGMMGIIFITFGVVKLIFRDKINIFDL